MIQHEYLRDPAYDVVPVTPDNVDLPDGDCKALIIGGAGTVELQMIGKDRKGVIRNSVPLTAGLWPLQCRQVRLGTTASDIWAVY